MTTPETDALLLARLWTRYHKLVYGLLLLLGAYLGGSGWGYFTSGKRITTLEDQQHEFLDSLRYVNNRIARQDATIANISVRVQFLIDQACANILESSAPLEFPALRAQCRRLSTEER